MRAACILGAILSMSLTAAQDRPYLESLARDTWHCIADLTDEKTGLPYDNSNKGEFTSVSNIGIYVSSVAAAEKMGFLSHADTVARLKLTISSLERLQNWHGFQQSWNSVRSLQPATHDAAISVLDTGNLAASLIAVGELVPEVRGRCRKLFKALEWSWFYDKTTNALFGGYDTNTGIMNPKWHLDALGTDAEMALFLAVASGQAPPSLWSKLNKSEEERYGFKYLWPGWQGGGLFVQYISGLWLDNRRTLLKNSAKSFAAAQIEHGKRIGSPVWGWSACDDPLGGYLGWGGIKDEVSTPHASVLSIEHFPTAVVANLREFDRLGVRSKDRGFYDSYDWKRKKVSARFLILDQGMLFLSLANYLRSDCIRKAFQRDATVQRGRALIPIFQSRQAISSR